MGLVLPLFLFVGHSLAHRRENTAKQPRMQLRARSRKTRSGCDDTAAAHHHHHHHHRIVYADTDIDVDDDDDDDDENAPTRTTTMMIRWGRVTCIYIYYSSMPYGIITPPTVLV